MKTHLSTIGTYNPPEGPFTKVRITAAGTSLRHVNRAAPGVWEHPTAEAKSLNEAKEGVGTVDSCAADNIIPPRKGEELGECLEIAAATDSEPAD